MDALITRRGSPVVVPVIPAPAPWVRNPSWPACNAVAGDDKFVGLYRVNPEGGNFFAVTCSGAYTVDFGDGTTTNFGSAVTAYYNFDYADADLAGTDAPVTFTDSTDTVNRTAHGYENGDKVQFWNIVTTTGITAGQTYYVINKTADTFQISVDLGGTAVTLTNDGSATLLPYKIATVTITPQVGSDLTAVDLYVKHNETGLVNNYSTGWLDIAIACNTITTLTIGTSTLSATVVHRNLERVRLNELGAITNFSYLFANICATLQDIVIDSSITTVTDTSFMFTGCSVLTTVPLFDTTAVTNMATMFQGCTALTTVPLFDTAAVTNMQSMFQSCSALTTVPLFNTAAVTTMASMFIGCRQLTSVPLFVTSAVTDMQSMFNTCTVLTTVPLFNTTAVTNMQSMFNSCGRLTTVPLFNTAAVTTMNTMFNICSVLTTVPLFNTAAVTNMATMFQGCTALTTVPLFNTAAVTSMQQMFNNCGRLTTVPLFNTAAVTTMQSMFSSCPALTTVPLFDTATVTTMQSMFTSCTALTTVPLFDTSAVGNMSQMFSGCFRLTTVPLFDTSAVGNMSSMFSGCQNLPAVPALVTTAVGASSGFSSTFVNCRSLASIKAADFRFTFSVANCKLSGAALNEIYTNLPTVTSQTITVSGNYGVNTDTPSIATGKGWTVTG